MKILVVWHEHFGYLESMVSALNRIEGVCADKFELQYFSRIGNRYEKIFTKLKIKDYRSLYMKQLKVSFMEKCRNYRPDVVLVLNGNIRELFDQAFWAYTKKHNIATALWFMDTIKGSKEHDTEYLHCFDKIYTVEVDDVLYMQEKYSVAGAEYLPIGANEKTYSVIGKLERKKQIDICFIGASDGKRIRILDYVAKYCCKNNFNMAVYGQMWKQRPWIQKIKHEYMFKNKYKELYKFVINKHTTPKESSDIYNRSKICLNIIAERHNSPNPRTFEISASGGFQILEFNETCAQLFEDGKQLVMYNSLHELERLLDYYLQNEAARATIADNGHRIAMKRYLTINSMQKIVADFKEVNEA